MRRKSIGLFVTYDYQRAPTAIEESNTTKSDSILVCRYFGK